MERGCGTARNRGIIEARGNVFAFTDSDCRPDPEWIERGVKKLLESRADIVGGEIKVFAADEANPTDVELFDKVFGFEQARYIRWKHFAAGANIFTTRPAFERIGPFRNGEQPEDLEWGRRAAKLGCKLAFAPDAIIRHPARRTWYELRTKVDRTIFHARNYARARGFFLPRWLFLTAALATPPLVKLWILATTRELAGPRQRLRAARCLLRVRFYRVAQMAGLLVRRRGVERDRLA